MWLKVQNRLNLLCSSALQGRNVEIVNLVSRAFHYLLGGGGGGKVKMIRKVKTECINGGQKNFLLFMC